MPGMPMGMGEAAPYPGGDEIMQGQEQAQAAMGGQNPIVDALKTIQMYVVAQKEKGNQAPLQGFMAFIDSLQGQGGMPQGQIPQAPMQPQEPQAQPAPMPMMRQGQGENQGKATVLTQ